MANTCFSIVRITHKDPEKIRLLEEKLEKATSANPLNADYGNEWLGNLLLDIGVSKEEVVHGETRCRGSIDDITLDDDNTLRLDTSTAWCPHVQCIKDFVTHYVPDCNVLYEGTEEMCDLFWTNDPDVADCVVFDYYLEDDRSKTGKRLMELFEKNNYGKKKHVTEALQKYFKKPDVSFEKLAARLMDEVEDMGGDNFLSIHVYDFVEISREHT